MHPARLKRVCEELKDAKALSLTVRFELAIGYGAITNTLEFKGMPSLLFEAGGKQIIKCLPLNQLGMGDTKDEAFEALGEDLADMLKEIFDESGLFKLVEDMMKGKAAQIYWDKYTELSKESPKHKEIKRRVENIELETDTAIDPALFEKYLKPFDPAVAA